MSQAKDGGAGSGSRARFAWQPRRWTAQALQREAARHARFVAGLKIGLPLAAAALIAVLVAWPYLTARVSGLRLSFAEVEETADGKITMTNARYLGTDREGQPFTITADSAVQNPDDPDSIELERLAGDVTLNDGTWVTLSADGGVYRQDARVLELAGHVSLYADSGYELRTEAVHIDLNRRLAAGDGLVEGQGPLGHVSAQGFRVGEGGERLEFLGPVRLTLYPRAEG